MNKRLPFKVFHTNLDGSVLKNYWAATTDCKVCPMKSSCIPNTRSRKITRTVYDEQYLRAYGRQHSKRGRQTKKLRQSTVEPVFGSLTNYYGLRKIGVLGKDCAHKVMLMAAIAFNIKKYLRKGGRRPFYAFYKALIETFRRHLPSPPAKPVNQYQFING